MWPHRQQLTRLPHPWDSPGKNTGVGCHFLLQCMKVKSESEVAQSCPTLSDPMDCSLPGSPTTGFSRQEYWSGLPLPSLKYAIILVIFVIIIMRKITKLSCKNALSSYYDCYFSSVAQLCPTLCDPMNRSTPGLPVHHQLPEFTQTYVHRVSDAIQPSHPLSSLLLLPPIPPSIRVFSRVNSSHEVAKVLEFQL